MLSFYPCSVMETSRTLTLAEKGGDSPEVIVAAEGFRLVATMNPGGDYGKKELSPALSNRFTQIWVPQIEDVTELEMIVEANLSGGVCYFRSRFSCLQSIELCVPLPPIPTWLSTVVFTIHILMINLVLAWIQECPRKRSSRRR